jgi:ribose transport system substrate-binding protein
VDSNDSSKYVIPMVSKALDVLELFSTHREELTLEQIICRTRVPHASAFRIVQTLVRRGYLTRIEPDKRYRLSWNRKKLRVGYAGLSNEVPFAAAVGRSLERAAEEAGCEVMLSDNQGDPHVAIQNAREMVSKDIDFAIEFQRCEKVAPVLANIFGEAGVKTIAIHIPQPGAIYFGVDNYKAGLAAGETLGRHAASHWGSRVDAVVLLDVPQGGQALHSRMLGVLHGIERFLGAIPPDRQHWLDGAGRFEASRKAMVHFLRRNPNVKHMLVSAVSDHSALGAAATLKTSRICETAAIVGHDGDPEALREISEPNSPYLATIAFFADRYGRELIDLITRIHRGESVNPAHYVNFEVIDRVKLQCP